MASSDKFPGYNLLEMDSRATSIHFDSIDLDLSEDDEISESTSSGKKDTKVFEDEHEKKFKRPRAKRSKSMGEPPRPKRKKKVPWGNSQWSLTEKKHLLEGLKSYGAHNVKLIANLLGSKTEKEVQEKIFCLKGASTVDAQMQNAENGGKHETPIENWIHTLSELVCQEKTDLSKHVSQILGFIAKHEKFEETDVPGLSWKRIYTFLYKMAEDDTAKLPTLTDIESLILLELLTELGQSLHTSDTAQQRQILELKSQIFCSVPPKDADVHITAHYVHLHSLVSKALANDFSDLEDKLIHSASPSETKASNSYEEVSSSDPAAPGPSGIQPAASIWPSQSQQAEAQSKLVSLKDVDPERQVTVRATPGMEKIFVKPKLFSLNPLCIPTQLLDFKPK